MPWGGNVLVHFDHFTLDPARRELRADGAAVAVEPQVFDLLVYLIDNRDRVVSKDDLIAAVWQGRIVSDSTLDSRINAARKAIGDNGKDQRLLRTVARKGVRFVGTIHDGRDSAPAASAPGAHLQQDVRFCTAADGVRIAYAAVGQGMPLVKAANWLNHLEYDWQSPIWRHLFAALAGEYRLIRYDERGNGLSDWDVADISFDAFVRDLEAVADAIGIERFPLFGMSQGCAVCIAYAVMHPERVSHLVLHGGFARGMLRRGSPQEIAMADAMSTMMLHGWGQENPAFRQLFTTRLIPNATAEQMQWMNDLQRMTTTPEMAVRLRHATNMIDVTGLLGQVRVPTLVMHCRGDATAPFEEGRLIAAGIPGSRFVALEGDNHIVLETDIGRDRMLAEIRQFLKT
jgi:pimeloyl-ACP methyl ester carboxylesterase/DNA-binding winged helix-turn-helix (wHTH) protein